jgi:hypothetical protein
VLPVVEVAEGEASGVQRALGAHQVSARRGSLHGWLSSIPDGCCAASCGCITLTAAASQPCQLQQPHCRPQATTIYLYSTGSWSSSSSSDTPTAGTAIFRAGSRNHSDRLTRPGSRRGNQARLR